MLTGKNILIIITGGIAAYKSLDLIRKLKDRGSMVTPVMTQSAENFVTPMSVSALSQEKVYNQLFDLTDEAEMGHIELSRSADLIIVVPASADFIAKTATGQANDLASTIILATDTNVLMAPAMNVRMWENPLTQKNVKTLDNNGIKFIGPNQGQMACGEFGFGRMAEVDEILEEIELYFCDKKLHGLHFLVTSGPTREAIDKVRYISNHSSGKMGFALAKIAVSLGAQVTIITGPTNQTLDSDRLKRINVISTQDMYEEVKINLPENDIIIFAAAVSDFKPKDVFLSKLKTKKINLELVETIDIANFSSTIKTKDQFLVGFALENENEIVNAKEKLLKKNLDLIVVNSLRDKNTGFNYDTNKITIIDKELNIFKYELKDKIDVAKDIFNKIIELN